MATLLPIQKLTKTEKLRAMEELWTDLTRDEDGFASPAWHGEALRQTEKEFAAGKVKFIPWEVAKKAIRKRVG